MCEIFIDGAVCDESRHIKAEGFTGDRFSSLSAILKQPSSRDQVPAKNNVLSALACLYIHLEPSAHVNERFLFQSTFYEEENKITI